MPPQDWRFPRQYISEHLRAGKQMQGIVQWYAYVPQADILKT